jgi:predicted extracellular nuclease
MDTLKHARARLVGWPRLKCAGLAALSGLVLLMGVPGVTMATTISAVQGHGHRSPLEGRHVTNIVGIVTAVDRGQRSAGFWLQSEHADDDPRTAEGLYVVSGRKGVKVQAGDRVQVSGRIVEWSIPKRWDNNRKVTALRLADISLLDRGAPLPPPVIIGADRSLPPVDVRALDWWEQLEGMRVALKAGAVIVDARNRHDETWVLAFDDARGVRSVTGALRAATGTANLNRIALSPRPHLARRKRVSPDVGSSSADSIVGIATYAFGNYRIALTQPVRWHARQLEKTPQSAPGSNVNVLTVATYNTLNLGGKHSQADFDKRARQIGVDLAGPDIVALQEIMDDSGDVNNGVESASRTLGRLTKAIQAAGGPRYKVLQIDPGGGQDGGIPGGNIRVVTLINPRKVTLESASKNQTVKASCSRSRWVAGANPYRLGSSASAFAGVRKPLATLLRVNTVSDSGDKKEGGRANTDARRLLLINLHLSSRRGDGALAGVHQPPRSPSVARRTRQTRLIAEHVRQARKCEPQLMIVVAGDMNAPPDSPELVPLTRAGLIGATTSVDRSERFSYIYQGNAVQLDQILVAPGGRSLTRHQAGNITVGDLSARVSGQVLHINSIRPEGAQVSDHDPVLARIVFNR